MSRLLLPLLLLMASACTSASSDAPSEAGSVRSPEASSLEQGGSPPADEPLPVSYDLDACMPASLRSLDAAFDETARVEEGGATYALVEWVPTNASRVEIANSFHPVLLRIKGEGCESLLAESTDSFDIGQHVSDAALRSLYLQNTEWKAERVGGLEDYVAFLQPDGEDTLVECGEDDDLGACVDGPRAEALRTLCVEVQPPMP